MKNIYFITLSLLAALTLSCTSQKKLSYFNKLDANAADSINQKSNFQHEATIKPGDMLIITVGSSDPRTVATFNLPVVAFSSPSSDQFYGTQTQQAYTVDVEGAIAFPVLGKIEVKGRTRAEIIALLTGRLKEYVQDPIVNIKYLNFNITLLGEVARPGQYPINNERTTLLDALSMAGDITPYGKKGNVLITRENNGKLEFARLNLNNESIFNSPYYYVQQNDVIYVEPNAVRSISSQNIPLLLSSISTLATLVTLTYSISQANKK